ncbi:hypothetical protein PAMA_016873 [Pampus argenteus]
MCMIAAPPCSLPAGITANRGSAGATMAAAVDREGTRGADMAAGSGVAGEPDGRLPVPMNLFATWEIDRSSPSCVPRLCSLTLKRLMVLRELDRELSSVVIAVKIQGSKRTLRSNEYLLPPDGLMETDLELTFTLQYPHFLKRDANRLHVMLQRRKRYKNRTILGYKTLAVGVINMAEDALVRAAELSVHSLSSQPIEQEDTSSHYGNKTKASDRSPDMENYWEDDDDSFSSEQEGSDDAVADQDMYDDDDDVQGKTKKSHRKMIRAASLPQVLDSDPVGQSQEAEEDLDLLYDSLEVYNPSDSGPELDDNDSIVSTPKPKLRPFFEGISQSSSQTEIWSLHSQRSQQKEQSAAMELLCPVRPAAQGPQPPDESRAEEVGMGEDVAMGTDAGPAAKLCKTESQTHMSPRYLYLSVCSLCSETGSQLSVCSKTGGQLSVCSKTGGQLSVCSETGGQLSVCSETGCPLSVCSKTGGQLSVCSETGGQLSVCSETGCPLSVCSKTGGQLSVCSETRGQLSVCSLCSKTGVHLSRHPWSSMKDRQNSKGTDRSSSVDSETPPQYLSELLFDQPIVCTLSAADVQAAFSAIISRIQRFCNCNSQTPPTIKVAVGGDQSYLSTVLCCFVEQMASKTPDWLSYVRFLILPVGLHPLAKFLSTLDSKFNSLFMDAGWRELFGRLEPPPLDPVGVAGRVSQYLTGAAVSHLCPISEAMLTCKHKSSHLYSHLSPLLPVCTLTCLHSHLSVLSPVSTLTCLHSHLSVLSPVSTLTCLHSHLSVLSPVSTRSCLHSQLSPLSAVSTLSCLHSHLSVDSDDIILGSPPAQSGAPISIISTPPPSPSTSCPGEVMGLQVDYWSSQGGGGGERRKDVGVKNTLKSNFRSLQVTRISGGELMSMTVVTKEKNKKGEEEDDEGDCEDDEGDCEDDEGDCEEDKGDSEDDEGDCEDDEGDCEDDEGDCEDDEGDCEEDEGDSEDDEGDCEEDEGD